MKKILAHFILVFSTVTTLICCKKETDQRQPNRPPVADAGPDKTIALPTNFVGLDGSNSTDPDNNIVKFEWSKIAGPASFLFDVPGGSSILVKSLEEGVYQFELKITDAGGYFDRDTVQVTVQPNTFLSIEWQKTIGGSRADVAQNFAPTPDGGYIIAGNTNSEDGDVSGFHSAAYSCYVPCVGPTICGLLPDGLIVKLSNTGTIEWEKSLGGTAAENLLSVQPTPDGGYITSGLTYSNDGDVRGYHGGTEADAWVVKLSSTGAIEWQKTFGGSNGCDFANYILNTPDGGYVFVGHTDSDDGDVTSNAGERDVWIVKLTKNGTIQWQKTIGGAKNDYAYMLQVTNDAGYILTGYTYSNNGDVSGNHGDADAWVVKLNNVGNIQWQKSLGGSSEDIGRSVIATPDGGYIVAGSTMSYNGDVIDNHGFADAWVVKLSGNGSIEWQKCLGGTREDVGRSIQLTLDGGYIVAGSTFSTNGDVVGNHGSQDAWLVKLSSTGLIKWQRALGGTATEFVNSVQLSNDGGYVIAGQTNSTNGDVNARHGGVESDAWILKVKQ